MTDLVAKVESRKGGGGIGTTAPAGNLDIENGANTAQACINGNCSSRFGPYTGMTFITATGAGTWTVPTGVTKIKVTVIGGGGGGGSVIGAQQGGGGGGAGGYCEAYMTVTSGSVISYSVGAGGGAGTDGGASTFNGSAVSVAGGGGGSISNVNGAGGAVTACPSGMGVVGFVGSNPSFANWVYVGNSGADTYKGYGTGGLFVVASINAGGAVAGRNAQGYGAGGGGAVSQNNGGAASGGTGAGGMILIEY